MPSMHPPIHVTAEGGGYVLTCECDWTRFYATRPQADVGRRDHAAKCKGPKVTPELPAARRAASASWDDREDSTWIDKL